MDRTHHGQQQTQKPELFRPLPAAYHKPAKAAAAPSPQTLAPKPAQHHPSVSGFYPIRTEPPRPRTRHTTHVGNGLRSQVQEQVPQYDDMLAPQPQLQPAEPAFMEPTLHYASAAPVPTPEPQPQQYQEALMYQQQPSLELAPAAAGMAPAPTISIRLSVPDAQSMRQLLSWRPTTKQFLIGVAVLFIFTIGYQMGRHTGATAAAGSLVQQQATQGPT